VALCLVACAAFASAVPVTHHGLATAKGVLQAEEQAGVNPNAPILAGSFHTAYSIYALHMEQSLLPDLSNLLDRASRLLDGEAWQNIDAAGQITIKTVTTPSLIGRAITAPMTQTWVKDHGWTQKGSVCTRDAVNAQLVIPGTILRDSGVFVGTQNIKTIKPQANPKPQADGTYKVDRWDATLPNGAGSVSYYLLNGVTPVTPLMSHYVLKGKPAVWAQYTFFMPGENPEAAYEPTPQCAAAAKTASAAPATFSNAAIAAAKAALTKAPVAGAPKKL